MHPPLFRPHPLCSKFVDRLVACHEEQKLGKWFGACNTLKAELDQCFLKEKEAKRDLNLLKSREFDARYEKYQETVKMLKEAGDK
jgi:COX assembly protein 2